MSGYGFDGVADAPLAEILDVASASVTYHCEAKACTSSSSPNWRCRKMETIGGVTRTTWADGAQFSQIADDRASLTYT